MNSFFEHNGWLDLGIILEKSLCKQISEKVINSRPWDETLFRSESDIKTGERHLNVVPTATTLNLVNNLDLSFIEDNHIFKETISSIPRVSVRNSIRKNKKLKNSTISAMSFIGGGVEIGDNVIIGTGCKILPGIKIGDNSTIGIGSIVTSDIDSNSIVYPSLS